MDMTTESCRKFVEVLASDAPAPGGGGAAALVGAIGTALGNMIDRLATGSVTDFLSFAFIKFPVFNVADIFVTCGVAVSLFLYLQWEASVGMRGESDANEGQTHA